MKARFYTSASLGVALAALPFVGGCTQQKANQSASFISTASAEPAVSVISSNTPAESPSAPAASAETASAETLPVPAPILDSEKKLPANIKPTGPAAEVIKLAQAGVDEAVMLNYITNTGSMFVLSSDDIIYLNDLGVADNIVTAMMQHDQGLKANWSNQVAQPPPATEQAAAPTYVNPPQPEPQPQPAQVETAPPPAANVTDNYFNDSLAPYGTWVDVEGYGRCWQPTVVVVNRGWRPYSDRGRWVYTDSGWYWMSDYSWGSTTFHYGRWFDHPRWGWCWWPDNVWAPSWVSWRYSGDYCGWAPLPPAAYYRTGFGFSYYGSSVGVNFGFGLGASCFTFVPWGRFCDSRPYHYRVPHHQVTQIYNHTTIVNNYGNGRNNTVVNHGIPADRVREHTRTELRPVRIREQNRTVGSRPAHPGERLERDGHSLVVSRPRIPESAAAKPLTAPPVHTEAAREHGRQPGVPTGTSAQNVVRTPTSPAGTTRVPGRDGQTEVGRERYNRPGPANQPPSGTTVIARTPPTAPPAAEFGETPAPKTIENHQPTAPSTAMSPTVRPGRGVPSSAPSRSLVVIGKRDPNSNGSIPGRPGPTTSVPGSSAVTRPATTPAPMASSQSNPSVQQSAPNTTTAAGGAIRSESPAPRATPSPGYNPRPPQTYSSPSSTTARPSQSAPTFESNRPQNPPGYSAPRTVTAPPTYSGPALTPAPRSTPSPSYTPRPSPAPAASAPSYAPRPAPSGAAPAPAVSAPRSAPVESRPAPAPSSNTRPESGGRNRP